ncbi:mucin-binding protein [Limosilactobacillus mucosae]|uniref:mucin-binding protein n=1 Tax=Limosilactobacillus mucosae TaxID=97478 RepID=UPI0022E05910|nr:LPXTG cell wall anchor domain-containing protein [Limosilactobacillus mucosae]
MQAVKTITRTIHYVDGDNNNQAVAGDVVQSLTYYGTPTDAAGTKFTWQAAAGNEFASVDSPVVANMTPDLATVAAAATDENSANTEITVVYHHDLTTENVEKTVQRTIHFVDEQGNQVADDVTQTVTLTGTKSTDLVTGNSTTVWNQGQFASVDAPSVANMTPEIAVIAAETVDENSADSEITVVYHATPAVDPVDPTTPGTPAPSTPDQPTTPNTPAATSETPASALNTPVVTVTTSPMNNRQNTAKTSQKTLPQTGNEQTGLLAALGLGLSSLALSLTGAFKKRHN